MLQREPDNIEALAGLARVLIAKGEHAGARELLSRVPREQLRATPRSPPPFPRSSSPSRRRRRWARSDSLRARLEKDANDHEARFELATALFGAGQQREAGIDELLTLFRKSRAWNDEAARKQLVKFFEVMGPTDPLTLSSRRRLSSLMFS